VVDRTASTADTVDIVPLTPDRWDDVAALFGEGGDPKSCWSTWQVGMSALRHEVLRS
jgi:hypothetical protein